MAAFAESSGRPSRSASTATARPRRRGAPPPCRSTSGSTRTGSSATGRSAASGRTSWPRACRPSCRASTSPRDRGATAPPRTSRRGRTSTPPSTAAGARPPLLVVVDFDGTLAIGSRDPAVARIEPTAQRALRHLARLAAERPARRRRGPDRADRRRRRRPGPGRRDRLPRRPRAAVRRRCHGAGGSAPSRS